VKKLKEFVEVVKQTMREQSINGVALAERVGKSSVYIYDLLKGKRRWNADMIDKVCEVLGIGIEFRSGTRETK